MTRLLFEGVYLFVPQDEALPCNLKYSDIGTSRFFVSCVEYQVMKQIDDIHYETVSGMGICMIGCDIRTGKGFPKERCLFLLKSYELSEDDIKSLFGIRYNYEPKGKVGLLHICIVNGFFVFDD